MLFPLCFPFQIAAVMNKSVFNEQDFEEEKEEDDEEE
jgi:hypothetical protein